MTAHRILWASRLSLEPAAPFFDSSSVSLLFLDEVEGQFVLHFYPSLNPFLLANLVSAAVPRVKAEPYDLNHVPLFEDSSLIRP